MPESGSVSGWTYVSLGFVLGAAAGLLAAPLLRPEAMTAPAEQEPEDEGPSAASKLIAKIPTKVKVAGAIGGIKGAGGEAYREIKQGLERKLSSEEEE